MTHKRATYLDYLIPGLAAGAGSALGAGSVYTGKPATNAKGVPRSDHYKRNLAIARGALGGVIGGAAGLGARAIAHAPSYADLRRAPPASAGPPEQAIDPLAGLFEGAAGRDTHAYREAYGGAASRPGGRSTHPRPPAPIRGDAPAGADAVDRAVQAVRQNQLEPDPVVQPQGAEDDAMDDLISRLRGAQSLPDKEASMNARQRGVYAALKTAGLVASGLGMLGTGAAGAYLGATAAGPDSKYTGALIGGALGAGTGAVGGHFAGKAVMSRLGRGTVASAGATAGKAVANRQVLKTSSVLGYLRKTAGMGTHAIMGSLAGGALGSTVNSAVNSPGYGPVAEAELGHRATLTDRVLGKSKALSAELLGGGLAAGALAGAGLGHWATRGAGKLTRPGQVISRVLGGDSVLDAAADVADDARFQLEIGGLAKQAEMGVKGIGALLGGVGGAYTGARLAPEGSGGTGFLTGAAAGAGAGALGGHYLGRAILARAPKVLPAVVEGSKAAAFLTYENAPLSDATRGVGP